MEPKQVKIKVVSGNDIFGVRKNAFVVMHRNEEGKIHFVELEGMFNLSEYVWEPPKNAKLSFVDPESNVGFAIEIACNTDLSSQILEFNPVTATVAEPQAGEKEAQIVPHKEFSFASDRKISIFSVVGMIVGAICSINGLVSALSIQKNATGRSVYSLDALTELYQKIGTSTSIAVMLLGVLIICYFGNHLYKSIPNEHL